MALSKTLKQDRNILTFSGEGAINDLENLLARYKNVLVFNDSNGFQPCGAEDFFKAAQKSLKNSTGFHSFPYTGKALPIEDIQSIYKEVSNIDDADLIVAVGGGTIIDLAKIISIAYSNHCENVTEIIIDKELENTVDTVYIPTTAGTGSEATSFAVVYQDKVKLSIDKKSLLPDFVVLDPMLLISLPKAVLNATVLDALAQAIEAAWAKGTNLEARDYAEEAIALIFENYNKDDSLQRLSQLQIASHLAGKAINISKTTLSHSISYPMTSYFGVPHGIAVFLTLPQVAELNYNANEEDLQPGLLLDHIDDSFVVILSAAGIETIETLHLKFADIMAFFGLSTRLRDYGIQHKDLQFLADNALTKGRSDNNPRKVDGDTILAMLEKIY
jgi:alcohol dehydrogenase class IV